MSEDMRISRIILGKENVDLYRDDSFSWFQNLSGTELNRKNRKTMQNIEILQTDYYGRVRYTNDQPFSYFDVIFNLITGKHNPSRKEKGTLLYISKQSNNPLSIVKQFHL